MKIVGPGNRLARGAPMAEGVWNSGIPDGVEVCILIIKVHIERVAPSVDACGVQRLVDIADEV